jgi:hypothetical protein
LHLLTAPRAAVTAGFLKAKLLLAGAAAVDLPIEAEP